MKKLFLIVAIVLRIDLAAASTYFWYNRNNSEKNNNLIAKAKENALSTSIQTNSVGDVLITKKPDYQIIYIKKFDQFLISVTKSPFEKSRERAEKTFLEMAQTDEDTACQLKVAITTPYYANPDLVGKSFPLSFCEQTSN